MKQRDNGFTLVEILVTIAIIGIGAGSITGVFISIQNIQRRASYADMATRAAQREIETLRNQNYASLTPGQTITFTSQLPSSLPSRRTGTATVSQPDDDLRRVDVTVSYTTGGGTNTITLSSLIGVIGISK